MDIPLVLDYLRPGEDWGPCAQSNSPYVDLAKTWRSKKSECPSEQEMLKAWTDIVKPKWDAIENDKKSLQALVTKLKSGAKMTNEELATILRSIL